MFTSLFLVLCLYWVGCSQYAPKWGGDLRYPCRTINGAIVLSIYTYVKASVLPQQYGIVIQITNPLTSVLFCGNV